MTNDQSLSILLSGREPEGVVLIEYVSAFAEGSFAYSEECRGVGACCEMARSRIVVCQVRVY